MSAQAVWRLRQLPYNAGNFEIKFDFIKHQLFISTSRAVVKTLKLKPQSVAEFYRDLSAALRELGIKVKIRAIPDEFPEPIPFAEDTEHASYDAEYVNRFCEYSFRLTKFSKNFAVALSENLVPFIFSGAVLI